MIYWLRRVFRNSWHLGPFYVSTWDWQRQHEICCRVASAERET